MARGAHGALGEVLPGPLFIMFMTPYDVTMPQMSSVFIYIVDIKLVDGLVLSVLWLSAGMALDKVIMINFPSLNGKIVIHDSQFNLRCRAINNFKIFCRMNALGPNNIFKMTSSQYSEMTLASWRLQPWATRLFVRQIIQTNNKAHTKAPYHWVLWEPSITGGFSSQKSVMRESSLILWQLLNTLWRNMAI